ncbi:hypothetical protein BH20ACI1_BH20ACI1_10810 [soil metagenome]
MRFLFFTGFYLLFSTTFFFSENSKQPFLDYKKKETAEEVLKKVFNNLSNLKTLKYKYHLELNYSSEGYHNELTADSYLDFNSVDKIIGLKYQFNNEEFLTVFNGSEKFDCNKKSKLIKIDNNPTYNSFKNVSTFFNSPLTLRNVLPAIISDSSIPKTIAETSANNRNFYVVEFVLEKKVLNRLGGFLPIPLDRKTIYRLTIDKTNYLPVEVLQTNNANQDFMKTDFSNIVVNSGSPDKLSWYYSTYLKEYKIKENGEKSLLIATGQSAPDWRLPIFDTNDSVSLSQFKNKVVMLEFWISNCGYCIDAVPKLNALSNQYKNKDFKLLAVNFHDSKEIIKLFQKNHQPVYEILSSGEETAKNYGVEGFPTIVLIDKKGNVIYSGSFDKERLEELINKNIN